MFSLFIRAVHDYFVGRKIGKRGLALISDLSDKNMATAEVSFCGVEHFVEVGSYRLILTVVDSEVEASIPQRVSIEKKTAEGNDTWEELFRFWNVWHKTPKIQCSHNDLDVILAKF